MTNSLLSAGVVLCLCVGLWGQPSSSPFTANPPDVMDATENHARDPVGFESSDARDPQNPNPYPDEVIGAIQARWYRLVSELRQASYDQQQQ